MDAITVNEATARQIVRLAFEIVRDMRSGSILIDYSSSDALGELHALIKELEQGTAHGLPEAD